MNVFLLSYYWAVFLSVSCTFTELGRGRMRDWIWGYVDDRNNSKNMPTDEELRAKIPECAPYLPGVPDYSMPGRRISQVKCLETLWYIQYRQTLIARQNLCRVSMAAAKGVLIQSAIGGRNARDGEFPHMGALGWKAPNNTWDFKCGAILISKKHALTAGHCTQVSSKDPTVVDTVPKIVRFGETDLNAQPLSENSVDAKIINLTKHPAYNPPKRYNDIAILEFEDKVPFSYSVHPACLWGYHDTSHLGKKAIVTGWGAFDRAGGERSPTLQVVKLDIIDQDYCSVLLSSWCNRNWCGLRDTQICAGELDGGVDACDGDSGGPLQVKMKLPENVEETMYYVIGVTSFGFHCAWADTPGVYTRVSSYIDWIEPIVWGMD